MRRSAKMIAAASALAAFLAQASASAQTQETFSLNQFNPAPAGDRFFGVQGGDLGGHVNPRVMVLGNDAYRPLVLYSDDGDKNEGSVVSDQLYVHLGFALGLWDRLSLHVDVPFALVTEGSSPSANGVAFTSP